MSSSQYSRPPLQDLCDKLMQVFSFARRVAIPQNADDLSEVWLQARGELRVKPEVRLFLLLRRMTCADPLCLAGRPRQAVARRQADRL
jgi:hypothetical protein